MSTTPQPIENPGSTRSITIGLILNAIFLVVEFIFSILTGSLALIADTANKLTDTFTLSVTFIASRIANRRADSARSFGYGRATILAALLNAAAMLAVAVFAVIKAIQRIGDQLAHHSHAIPGATVAIVALVGIAVDGSIAYVLYKHRSDLNVRSAFIDKILDVCSSVATVISGVIIQLTGFASADSIAGLVIAAMLVYGAYRIAGEAVHILLEGTPRDIDLDRLTQAITDIELVLRVDDIHVWAIRSGANSLTCHIVIHEEHLKHSRKIVERVKRIVRRDFGIRHATVEVEFESDTRAAGHGVY